MSCWKTYTQKGLAEQVVFIESGLKCFYLAVKERSYGGSALHLRMGALAVANRHNNVMLVDPKETVYAGKVRLEVSGNYVVLSVFFLNCIGDKGEIWSWRYTSRYDCP